MTADDSGPGVVCRLVVALLITASAGSVAWSSYALWRGDAEMREQERERRAMGAERQAVEEVRKILRERGWLEVSLGPEALTTSEPEWVWAAPLVETRSEWVRLW